MFNNTKKLHTRNTGALLFISIVLLVCVIISFIRVHKIRLTPVVNEERLLVSEDINEIKKGNYPKSEYSYAIITMDGKLQYVNGALFTFSTKEVNIDELITVDESFLSKNSGYHKLLFTTTDDNQVTSIVVFLIPDQQQKNQLTTQVFYAMLPLIIGMIVFIGVFAYLMITTNHRILNPIGEISESAQAIINGNYDREVLRVYDTKLKADEVGDLTYSFELMRDELREKCLREEQLKKSQQELISCISHDLKTPISTIKAYGEGIRDHIARTEEEQREYVQIILDKTNLLNTMISELLEYSNAELKELSIVKKEIYLMDYLMPMLKELEGFVEYNNVEFEAEVMDENPIVTIDVKRITEVFYNLVENSIKFRDDKEPKIKIIISRTNKHILVRVCDNGKGIHNNDIPYVFDKFYRAEKSRSSNIPGSGLGLSICKYIIEQHNGEIYCKSRSPKGCEFGFTILLS